MSAFRLIVAAALVIVAGTASAAPRLDPEARIAKALDGRVAGTPVDCLQQRSISSTEIVDRTAIIYRMNGGRVYLNRPTSGAAFLRSNLAMVTDTHSPELCSIDIVRMYDTTSRMGLGTIGLGKFVPYTKADAARP